MIKTGLCSVSFKHKTPKEVVELAVKAELCGIEWIGSTHVPAGNVSKAYEIGEITRSAGIEIASYGSIFKLGAGEDIVPHLESAQALGTTEMRIWAGNGKSSNDLSVAERQLYVNEAKEISLKAAEYGISLSTECHDGSLTDCSKSQLQFMEEVNELNFRTYWQELLSLPYEKQLPSLRSIYNSGKLTNLHIYQYKINESFRERQLLSDGFEKWNERFSLFKNDGAVRYALLEFVGDYTADSLYEDAKTLCRLTEIANS